MESPGVEVRPIRQATGASEFCEMFLDAVPVPVENRLGPENEGWQVAQGTLSSERAVVILEGAERLRRNGVEAMIEDAAGWTLADGSPALEDDAVQEVLAARYAESVMLRRLVNGMIDDVIEGRAVGATSAVVKVFYSELRQRLMRDGADIQGPLAHLERPRIMAAGWESGNWLIDYTLGGRRSGAPRSARLVIRPFNSRVEALEAGRAPARR